VQLQALASTAPPVGDAQPRADGAATFEGSGAAVTGVLWRVDAVDAHSAEADICIGSGVQSTPPQTGVCDMGGAGAASEGSFVEWGTCGPVVTTTLCLPVTRDAVSVAHGLASYVAGGSHVSYDMTVKAVRSRVSGWAFDVRF
jgi:hypothetical protein